jgi:hypothetical protein
MDLQNSTVGGVAGRVPSWINKYKNKLVDALAKGVNSYIAKNTDPYVLDCADKNMAILFNVTPGTQLGVLEPFPEVPCIIKLKDTSARNRDGFAYKDFPFSLFEERFQPYAELLVRLMKCSEAYMQAGQKVKKQIFQTLFSNDTEELNELLEDEA